MHEIRSLNNVFNKLLMKLYVKRGLKFKHPNNTVALGQYRRKKLIAALSSEALTLKHHRTSKHDNDTRQHFFFAFENFKAALAIPVRAMPVVPLPLILLGQNHSAEVFPITVAH